MMGLKDSELVVDRQACGLDCRPGEEIVLEQTTAANQGIGEGVSHPAFDEPLGLRPGFMPVHFCCRGVPLGRPEISVLGRFVDAFRRG